MPRLSFDKLVLQPLQNFRNKRKGYQVLEPPSPGTRRRLKERAPPPPVPPRRRRSQRGSGVKRRRKRKPTNQWIHLFK